MKLHLLALLVCTAALAGDAPDGWTTAAPRDEIKPAFSYDAKGGPDGRGSLVIESGLREGMMGRWVKSFSVKGGQHYRFSAMRKFTGSDPARRAGVARVLWTDAQGKPVLHDEPSYTSYSPGQKPRAEPAT